MLWLVLIVLVVLLLMRKPAGYSSDERTVTSIVKQITDRFPNMTPVNTVSIDGPNARMVFFDTKNYSGSVIDTDSNGIVPRKPADSSITPYVDGAYKDYDEILNFKV